MLLEKSNSYYTVLLNIKRRIGVLGGSFDPIHIGHLLIAQDALEQVRLDEVIFVPAFVPPHKQHLERVSSEQRLEMVRLAVEGDDRFSVSDQELKRGGVSYTIDTVEELKKSRPDVDWVLLVGSDTLVDLHSWHRIDELLNLCEIASFMRPGENSRDEILRKIQLPEYIRERLLSNLVDVHQVEISSTEVRQRVMDGASLRYLVPRAVKKYIYEQGLYQR